MALVNPPKWQSGYITEDGRFFEDMTEANEHQQEYEFVQWCLANSAIDRQSLVQLARVIFNGWEFYKKKVPE